MNFIAIAVKICGCHPHPSFIFSFEGFLGNQIKVSNVFIYDAFTLHVIPIYCMHKHIEIKFKANASTQTLDTRYD